VLPLGTLRGPLPRPGVALSVRLASLVSCLALVLATAPARAAEFIGAESCRACHAAAYEAWKDSPHARAMHSLTPAQQRDGRCVQCHAKDVAQGGDAGVSCETCHGAGGYYWPVYVMRDSELAKATGLVLPDAKSCNVCHDASSPALGPWDAAEKMKAIDHWTASRAARKGTKKAENCPRPDGRAAPASKRGAGFLARALRTQAPAAPKPVIVAKATR
jgi:hypothetical protein